MAQGASTQGNNTEDTSLLPTIPGAGAPPGMRGGLQPPLFKLSKNADGSIYWVDPTRKKVSIDGDINGPKTWQSANQAVMDRFYKEYNTYSEADFTPSDRPSNILPQGDEAEQPKATTPTSGPQGKAANRKYAFERRLTRSYKDEDKQYKANVAHYRDDYSTTRQMRLTRQLQDMRDKDAAEQWHKYMQSQGGDYKAEAPDVKAYLDWSKNAEPGTWAPTFTEDRYSISGPDRVGKFVNREYLTMKDGSTMVYDPTTGWRNIGKADAKDYATEFGDADTDEAKQRKADYDLYQSARKRGFDLYEGRDVTDPSYYNDDGSFRHYGSDERIKDIKQKISDIRLKQVKPKVEKPSKALLDGIQRTY